MPFFLLTLLLFCGPAWPVAQDGDFPLEGVVSKDVDSFYDVNIDYARFPGRVTDKDTTGNILKIKTENNNVKFFRSGDEVSFVVGTRETDPCQAYVRDVENFRFVIFVKNFATCFPKDEYFRRGNQLTFYSAILAKRVMQASRYRQTLLTQKDDFLKQLNKINHFLWAFDQEKVKLATEYDKRIIEIQKEKERAQTELLSLRKDSMILQKELMGKLSKIDVDLGEYRIERQELFTDRWNLDHDAGVPVGKRPQDIRQVEDQGIFKDNRWHKTQFQ